MIIIRNQINNQLVSLTKNSKNKKYTSIYGVFQYLMGSVLVTIDDVNYTVTMENENDNIDISRLFIIHTQ